MSLWSLCRECEEKVDRQHQSSVDVDKGHASATDKTHAPKDVSSGAQFPAILVFKLEEFCL